MKRDNGQGMFTMDFITEVSNMGDLGAAKAAVIKAIDASNANDDNKQKGVRLVHNSRSVKQLVIGMANFSLSHQGLSVK